MDNFNNDSCNYMAANPKTGPRRDLDLKEWVTVHECFLESSYDDCINANEFVIDVSYEEWCLMCYRNRKYS